MVITHNVLMVLMQTEDGLTSNCIHECWINFVCSRLYGNNDLWIISYTKIRQKVARILTFFKLFEYQGFKYIFESLC